MKQNKLASPLGVIVVLLCSAILFSGCVSFLRDSFFGKEDTIYKLGNGRARESSIYE